MANFPLLKAGGWLLGELLTPAQINALNAMLPKIPNFLEGSSHTPSSPIEVLGSSGMRISTLRGATSIVPDGATQPRVTLNGTKVVDLDSSNGLISAEAFRFQTDVETTIRIPLRPQSGTGSYNSGFRTAAPVGAYYYQTTTSPGQVYFSVPRLPSGCRIKSIGMMLWGISGGAGHTGVPTVLPLLELVSISVATGALSVVMSTSDAPADFMAYDTLHWWDRPGDLSGVTPYNPGLEYMLRYTGDSGANSVPNSTGLHSLRIVVKNSDFLP
jgi:hypothetical protein